MRFVLFLSAVSATASSLVRVNDTTFKAEVLDSGTYTLVGFYTDWCRHCLNLMPMIEKLADLYKDVPEVQIVKINGDEDGRKMTKKYDILGFPMLLMFHGQDEPVGFEGGRDLESISNFIQQVSGVRFGREKKGDEVEEDSHCGGVSKIIEINDDNFQDSVLAADHKTVIAFTTPWCKYSQRLKPVWSQLANLIFTEDGDTVRFAEVDLAESNKERVLKIVAQFGVSQMPLVQLFDPKKVDADRLRRPIPFTKEKSLESLLDFVNEHTGLGRNENGELSRDAGRIKHLDEVVRSVTSDTKQSVLDVIDGLKGNVLQLGKDTLVESNQIWVADDLSMIPYYTKLAVKVASGDVAYATKELSRMERIIAKNAKDLERSARDYMQKRINILKAHLGK